MPGDKIQSEGRSVGARNGLRWLLIMLCIAALAYLPFILSSRAILGVRLSNAQLLNVGLTQVNMALIAILGAVSLNYLTGCAGLVSIGHAAFYAVGAMAAAAAGSLFGLPFLVALAAAIVSGAFAGVLAGLPSLRVRGLYFVLSTLALHFIVVFLFSEFQYAFFDVVGVPFAEASLGPVVLDTPLRWYFFLLPLVALVCIGARNSLQSREGRAMLALRDHEQAAAASGIDVRLLRLKAFAFSSAIASLAGALQAYYLTNVAGDLYTLNFAIQFIAMIIIGGMGSIGGAVLGAIFWLLLPSVLTGLASGIDPSSGPVGRILVEHRPQLVNLIFGTLVAVLLIYAPGGIVGAISQVRRRFAQLRATGDAR